MRHNHSGRAGRPGFTLVELLIVMAIIAILVSLTAAAVYKVIGLGPRTACRTEIGELETAIQNFQNKFGVDYVPSRIRLVKNIAAYGTNPAGLDLDSRDYMLRLFPKIKTQWSTTAGIKWSQDPTWNGDSILEGHQCLVFFLGGIQVTTPNAGCVGFSTNPNDPSVLGGDRVGPFYDFKSGRLVGLPHPPSTVPEKFFSYLDPFSPPPAVGKKPYAYFSHYKALNGYNRYATLTPPSDNNILERPGQPLLGLTAGPYALALTPAPRYYKPDSFQIISAGPDGLFGPGGVLAPGNTAALGPNGEGRDNMTNFVPGRLEGGE
jgi:general secretion pathway protein G